jgi:HSP20 family protein
MARHKVHEHIEIVFSDTWQRPRVSGPTRGFRPNLDIYRTSDPPELTVIVEAAGIDPTSLTIAVSERTLVINGGRARTRADGRIYQQKEIEYGPFERRVRLTEDVDPERASARYDQGLLTISLPVSGPARARERHRIAVEHE